MERLRANILTILLFGLMVTEGAQDIRTPAEGSDVDIHCKPTEMGSMIIWIRVLDNQGWETIGSFSNTGVPKTPGPSWPRFNNKSIKQDRMILKSYNPSLDSGVYGCGSLKGSVLSFGSATRLGRVKAEVVTPAPPKPTTQPTRCTTAKECVCPGNTVKGNMRDFNRDTFCSLLILAPLAGGCGLLLLILIAVILYCNHVRTRRCPHHHKRRPRMEPPRKPAANNRQY